MTSSSIAQQSVGPSRAAPRALDCSRHSGFAGLCTQRSAQFFSGSADRSPWDPARPMIYSGLCRTFKWWTPRRGAARAQRPHRRAAPGLFGRCAPFVGLLHCTESSKQQAMFRGPVYRPMIAVAEGELPSCAVALENFGRYLRLTRGSSSPEDINRKKRL